MKETYIHYIEISKSLIQSLIYQNAVKLRSSERRYKEYAILPSDKVPQIRTKTKSVFAGH